jgi:hypothetical protein
VLGEEHFQHFQHSQDKFQKEKDFLGGRRAAGVQFVDPLCSVVSFRRKSGERERKRLVREGHSLYDHYTSPLIFLSLSIRRRRRIKFL